MMGEHTSLMAGKHGSLGYVCGETRIPRDMSYVCGKHASLRNTYPCDTSIISAGLAATHYRLFLCARSYFSPPPQKEKSERLFVRDRTRTSTGYSSGTALNLPRQGTSEARIVLRRFDSSTDERSEDRLWVRVGLDASFMAIYMNITVYTSEDHRNNRSDVFKCVKLKGFEQQHRWPVGRTYGALLQ